AIRRREIRFEVDCGRKEGVTHRIETLSTRSVHGRKLVGEQFEAQQITHGVAIFEVGESATHHETPVPALGLVRGQLTTEVLIGARFHPAVKRGPLTIVKTAGSPRWHLISSDSDGNSVPII